MTADARARAQDIDARMSVSEVNHLPYIDAVAIADLAHALQVARRWHDRAAAVLHRLHNDRRNCLGAFELDQSLDLSAVEPINCSAALPGRFQAEFPAGVFDDVLGLVIGKVMFTP